MIELDLNWWISSITFGFIKFWLGIVRTFLFIKTKKKSVKSENKKEISISSKLIYFISNWNSVSVTEKMDWKIWKGKRKFQSSFSNVLLVTRLGYKGLTTDLLSLKKGTGDFFHDYWFFGTTEKEGTGIFYTCFNKKLFKSCGSFVILFRWRQLEGWIGSLYQWCF